MILILTFLCEQCSITIIAFTTLYQNRPEDTLNWTNLYLEPHDYRIYYVNIDLRHQYGISASESQTFLRAKRPQRRRARRNGCFRRLGITVTEKEKNFLQLFLEPSQSSIILLL